MTGTLATPTSAVLADRLPGEHVRDVLLVIGFAGVIGLSAQVAIPLPFTPVFITGQTFAVLLGAASLGAMRAGLGAGLYLGLGLLGLPWFSPGSAASLGYIYGFVMAAAIVGALARRGGTRTMSKAAALMVLGNLVIYAFGVTYLALFLDVGPLAAISLGLTPFIVGDLIKIALAAALLPTAWRILDSR